MPKRLTDTAKWDDPWFFRLPDAGKLLWLYICDRCDASGVIDFCPEIAGVAIGHKLSEDSLKNFGTRVLKLPSGKWQIVKFLPFQYGTVDANCPAHKPVIRLIKANNLDYPIRYPIKGNLSDRLSNSLKEKEKEKEEAIPIKYPIQNKLPVNNPAVMTKYGLPLPPRCTIDKFGNVLDYTGRVMDVNQVRKAAKEP